MGSERLSVEQVLPADPALVWERISTPAGIARWWRTGDIAAVPGHAFTMKMGQWGELRCEVTEVEWERRLVYLFGDFTLDWEIVPDPYPEKDKPAETVLRLVHSGFDLDNPRHHYAYDNMGPGWRDVVLPRLAKDLEMRDRD